MTISELKEKVLSSPFFESPFYLKYHNLVVPIIVASLGLLITVLMTIPQFFRLFETFQKIAELEKRLVFLQEKAEKLESMDQREYQEKLDTALVALPVDKDITGVVGQILVTLSGSGMTLDGISVSSSQNESEKVQQAILRIDIGGSQEALENFLDRIRLTPRLIKLVKVEVSSASSSRLVVSVELMSLYQPLPEEIGAVGQPVPVLTEGDNATLADIKSKVKSFPQDASSGNSPVPVEGKVNPFAP